MPKSYQEQAGWENPIPQDGEQCPKCHHGILDVQKFGPETWVKCFGLEGDEDSGCGFEHIFNPINK